MLFCLLLWVRIISRSSKYTKQKQWKTVVYKKRWPYRCPISKRDAWNRSCKFLSTYVIAITLRDSVAVVLNCLGAIPPAMITMSKSIHWCLFLSLLVMELRHQFLIDFADWLTDWLTDLLTSYWLTDWRTDGLTDWRTSLLDWKKETHNIFQLCEFSYHWYCFSWQALAICHTMPCINLETILIWDAGRTNPAKEGEPWVF